MISHDLTNQELGVYIMVVVFVVHVFGLQSTSSWRQHLLERCSKCLFWRWEQMERSCKNELKVHHGYIIHPELTCFKIDVCATSYYNATTGFRDFFVTMTHDWIPMGSFPAPSKRTSLKILSNDLMEIPWKWSCWTSTVYHDWTYYHTISSVSMMIISCPYFKYIHYLEDHPT